MGVVFIEKVEDELFVWGLVYYLVLGNKRKISNKEKRKVIIVDICYFIMIFTIIILGF